MASEFTGSPWWDPDKGDVHRRLVPLVKRIAQQQATRYSNMRRMIAAYEGGFRAGRAQSSNDPIDDAKLHFGVAKNAIDTMHAQECTPRVDPMLLTEGGSYSQRKRAKECTQAVKAVFDEAGFEEVQEDVLLDAKLAYCGFAHVYSEVDEDEEPEDGDDDVSREARRYGRICIERVDPTDVFVDEAEGRSRAPRCLYRRHRIDRYKLLAMYGDADSGLVGSAASRRRAIERAKGAAADADEFVESTDMVEVWEAWHLPSRRPSRRKAKRPRTDGRHVIAIEGCDLVDEPWLRDRFPIAVYRPDKARRGFWGLAVMQQALAGQREYERVTERLQRAHKATATANVIASRAAKLNVRELTNGVGRIIEVDGDVSQIREWAPVAANSEAYQYREGVAGDVLRYLGVSSYAAQSEVPAGLSQASGKALHAFEDQENKRMILRHRARERFVIEVAELVIDEALALVDDGVEVVSRHGEKQSFSRIDWRDLVDVLRDKASFVVRTFPVSMLMSSPAAKFQQLDMMFDRGLITAEQFKRLFGLPDLEAEAEIDLADSEVIDRNIDHMVMTGEPLSPEPTDDLALLQSRVGKAINAYRIREVPDERIDLLRRYALEAATMQAGAAAAGMPQAAPASAPISPAAPIGPQTPMAGGGGPIA